MAVSVDPSSPGNLNKEAFSFMGSSPLLSPSPDRRIWTDLRSRVDTLLENRRGGMNEGESDCGKRLKEDSLLLLRGFDSVAHTLSQLSNNLDNAIQGARDLVKPPTLTEMFCNKLEEAVRREPKPKPESESEEEENVDGKKNLKRKSEDDDLISPKNGNLKNAKKIAVSMATRAASVARELKSIKSDLSFMQERCALLEEENKRLRDGFDQGIRPEEDDLVRLQLEALLAEKSRLASENANLTRENQCLKQLVEYHQLAASQDLDFSSEDGDQGLGAEAAQNTPRANIFRLSASLDERFGEEQV